MSSKVKIFAASASKELALTIAEEIRTATRRYVYRIF